MERIVPGGDTLFRNDSRRFSDFQFRDSEVFEIRIDVIDPKWSGSLEVGVTTQNPERFDYPETLSRVKTVFSLGDLEHLQVNNTARQIIFFVVFQKR